MITDPMPPERDGSPDRPDDQGAYCYHTLCPMCAMPIAMVTYDDTLRVLTAHWAARHLGLLTEHRFEIVKRRTASLNACLLESEKVARLAWEVSEVWVATEPLGTTSALASDRALRAAQAGAQALYVRAAAALVQRPNDAQLLADARGAYDELLRLDRYTATQHLTPDELAALL